MKTFTLNIDLLESDESLAVIQGIIAPETRLVSQIVDEQPRKKTLPILPAGYRYPARDAEIGQELRRKNIIVQSDETFEPHTGDILINNEIMEGERYYLKDEDVFVIGNTKFSYSKGYL